MSIKHLHKATADEKGNLCETDHKKGNRKETTEEKPDGQGGNRGGETLGQRVFACECLNKRDNPPSPLSSLSTINSLPLSSPLHQPLNPIQLHTAYTTLNRRTSLLLYLSLLLSLLLLLIVSLSLYHIHTPELHPFQPNAH